MADKRKKKDGLARYRAKRDFAVTAEPAGGSGDDSPGGRFVVQRHRATRLHYDLRLEMGGVLASWAVPKGPTLDPKARQLAVHVEDHPVEYYDFEGVIPGGEYGGGDVIVWDRGTWEPAKTGDPVRAVERGELHFDLRGEKLAGRFVLVRRAHDGDDDWLLIHKDDEYARRGWNPEDHPVSVKSGRTNEEVAAAPEALWRGDLPAAEASVAVAAHGHWSAASPEELAALAELGDGGTWTVGGHRLRLSKLGKVLFPRAKGRKEVTKRDLIAYHSTIAPYMLPYLAGRPVNVHRFPDGVERPGFWQKAVPAHAPEWLTTWRDTEAEADRTGRYAVVDKVASLAWMANHGAVELHPWISGLRDVHEPDWALIDIDPGEKTRFADILLLARLYGEALRHLGVEGMPKVTGQRGVQIWVPVRAGYTFEETREWVHKVSRAVGRTVPELVSWEWYKDRRDGLARLDYTQNVRNKTLVAPFSARPAPGAPVSVPITWKELDDPDLRPDRWTVHTVLDRVREAGDPLHELIGRPQELPPL
ncbi:DNA polymerase ligase N-terminal domain-containing protein [Phytomonospora sp. NPDC050363]|uniref:non-homologous end-joining DNA ligase LigD n=1 Tax=Phytomonospora sp. NPDC050363 TaxID=3155642 RepID=UPI0033CF4D4B